MYICLAAFVHYLCDPERFLIPGSSPHDLEQSVHKLHSPQAQFTSMSLSGGNVALISSSASTKFSSQLTVDTIEDSFNFPETQISRDILTKKVTDDC